MGEGTGSLEEPEVPVRPRPREPQVGPESHSRADVLRESRDLLCWAVTGDSQTMGMQDSWTERGHQHSLRNGEPERVS